MEGGHGRRAKYFCPCNLALCKGKREPILRKTIDQHFEKCGQEKVSDEYLKVYKPPRQNDQDSNSDDDVIFDADYSYDNSPTCRSATLSKSDGTNHSQELSDFKCHEQEVLDIDLPIHSGQESDTNTDSSDSDDEFNQMNMEIKQSNVEAWEPVYPNELFHSEVAKKKLYPGSKKTLLEALGERFAIFTSSNTSKTTISNFLALEKDTLPQPNCLLRNYYEARKIIQPFLLPVRKYDVCPNHCIVYRDSDKNRMYSSLDSCPECSESRYTARGRARRQVKYLPVGPRFARLFGNESLAAVIQHECNQDEKPIMSDIQDSPKFRALFKKNGYLEGESGGLVVGLESDGVAPFHSYNETYSFTIVTMPIFSLLRTVRMKFRNILIVMIIPGDGKSESSSHDAYMEILVDELLYLTKCGIVKDYTGAPMKLKIKLLLYIMDYPGFCKLFHLSGSGAIKGCIWCEISGVYCKHLSKTVYLRNRSYLPDGHYLKNWFFNPPELDSSSSHFVNIKEPTPPPKLRHQQECISYSVAFEKAKNKTQASSISSATGIKGSYSLMKLPGHDRIQESVPDGMHTIQRCLLNIHNLITGKDDTLQLRTQEKEFSRFPEVWPVNSSSESMEQFSSIKRRKTNSSIKTLQHQSTGSILPIVPYVIKNIGICNKRFSSVIYPFGTGIKASPIFTSTSALNSHDWKEIACKGILKFCIRGQLAEQQESTLFRFYDCISRLFLEQHQTDELDTLEGDMIEVLALMERDFPVCIQNITQHLLHHVVSGIKQFGPLYSTWMYGFERLNGWCSNRAVNKRHPESTIIETYLLFDFSQTLASLGILPASYLEGAELDKAADDEQENRKKEISLSRAVLDDIFREYCKMFADLDVLWTIYCAEKRKSKTTLEFTLWNPVQRNLSKEERVFTKPLNTKGLECQKTTFRNNLTGRVTTFSTQRKASERTDSSLVYIEDLECHKNIQKNDRKQFGRIVKIFQHDFKGEKHMFCTLEILDNVYFNEDINLWTCQSLDGSSRKTFALKRLKGPVAYAHDDGEVFLLF